MRLSMERGGRRPMIQIDRPSYRIPSMLEIAALPANGLRAVSIFSGCGGSCLGLRMAGFRVLWANEFAPSAAACYRVNFPTTYLDVRDVRHVTSDEILSVCDLAIGQLDLLDGSPPCQAFSSAGKRHHGWGKRRRYAHGVCQNDEELFGEYVRLLRGLMPRIFVAENVS